MTAPRRVRSRETAGRVADTLARWREDRMLFREEAVTLPDGRPFRMAPFQREDFAGRDRHHNAAWWRPRAHSKTFDAAVEAAGDLLLTRHASIFLVAADEDQAKLVRDDVEGIYQRHDLLRPLLKVTKRTLSVPATGSTLTTLPSDAPSAYGLRPTLVICDEVAEWRGRGMWDALFTSGAKRNARFLVIGTASWDALSIAREIRDLAAREPDWYSSDRQGSQAPWIAADWLGSQERALPPLVFRRLHLNHWIEGSGAFLSVAEVDAVFADFPDLEAA